MKAFALACLSLSPLIVLALAVGLTWCAVLIYKGDKNEL